MKKKFSQFSTYDEQIGKLRAKGLIILDEEGAKKTLKGIGYYDLIHGYRGPFIDPDTRLYIGNTTFEDILALYLFNKRIRLVSYGYMGDFEMAMHEAISYSFCQVYGDDQTAYLDPDNFNLKSNKRMKAFSHLREGLTDLVMHNRTHEYVAYQRKVHGNVPLWVAMKTFSFGQLSTFYSLLPFGLQSRIIKRFPFICENDLEQYLKCFTFFRNVCAHNGRLFSFRIENHFPDTQTHRHLGIPKDGKNFVLGKQDYFGLVIAFKYLLPEDEFRKFVYEVKTVIDEYFLLSQRLKNSLFDYLGFPSNWLDVVDVPK